MNNEQHISAMTYTTTQIEAKATETFIEYPFSAISYIEQYVCPGSTYNATTMRARFGDWNVYFEQENDGTWFVMSAHNVMTGTAYKMPMTWFANKMK